MPAPADDPHRRLPPCPRTPNCVSSEAAHPYQRMEPIPFTGEPAFALARLARVVEAMPGGRVKRRGELWLHAEFRTRWLRFVDDADLVVDPEAGVVRFRSASRLGRRDFGVNRRRMEELRRRFEAGDGAEADR